MKFCYIAPTEYIEPLELERSDTQLLLAHLVETDQQYVDIFAKTADERQVTILDNSAYELYREGKPMFDPSKMVELGKKVSADYLVLPDYPGEHSSKTIDVGMQYAAEFRDAGFGTFFVPQSKVGDYEDYIRCFEFAARSQFVDYIGVSILGCPNAFGVDGNPFQQYLARPLLLGDLLQRGLLQKAKDHGKKIHCLGMTDGPREIEALSEIIRQGYIDTWDSSAPVWAGINDVNFDLTPTGLRNGKIASAVDFAHPFDQTKIESIEHNITYIEQLIDYAR